MGEASSLFALTAASAISIYNSLFLNNSATNGGAILGYSGAGTFLFDGCEFYDNSGSAASLIQGLSDDPVSL